MQTRTAGWMIIGAILAIAVVTTSIGFYSNKANLSPLGWVLCPGAKTDEATGIGIKTGEVVIPDWVSDDDRYTFCEETNFYINMNAALLREYARGLAESDCYSKLVSLQFSCNPDECVQRTSEPRCSEGTVTNIRVLHALANKIGDPPKACRIEVTAISEGEIDLFCDGIAGD